MKICSIEGCTKKSRAKGMCDMHYRRMYTHGDASIGKVKHETCTVEGCGMKHHAKGYCDKHYQRYMDNGGPSKVKVIRDGRSKHPLWQTYKGMIERCHKENDSDYKYYGARGITVCEEWHGPEGFVRFCNDMGERPEGTTIDRRNNTLGYSVFNCRRANINQQMANTGRGKGAPGVRKAPSGRFISTIKILGVSKYIGTYDTVQEAIDARKAFALVRGVILD